MASVDDRFSADINNCLEIARRLSNLETEESQRFVSEQLRLLSDFLQKKQQDAENRVDEEIAEEQREIKILKTRIEKASTDTNDIPDIDITDYRQMWMILHERYWEKAFNAYISHTKEKVKTILDNLITILKTSHNVCTQKANSSRDDIVHQILQPGEVRHTQQPTKGTDQTLLDLSTKCQKACILFCLASVKKEIFEVVKHHKDVKVFFASNIKELDKALQGYLEKCVEFCWVAHFEDIKIVSVPKKECKHIAHQFQGLEKTTHAARKCHVEWPALVQGEAVIVPWQLYDLSKDRPLPKRAQLEASQQYRAVRTEDGYGREIREYDEVDKSLRPALSDSNSHLSSGSFNPSHESRRGAPNANEVSGQEHPIGRNGKTDESGKKVAPLGRKNDKNNLNRRDTKYHEKKQAPHKNIDF